MRCKILKPLAIALGAALALGGALEAQEAPKGLFVLNDDKKPWPIPEAAFRDDALDGISLRQSWGQVEPKEGKFDFSYFDGQIARAKGAGKKVMLRVFTGFRGRGMADWVYGAGAQKFEYDGSGWGVSAENAALPVPWDPVFLAKWKSLIQALGQKYGAEPAIVLVQIAGLDYSGGEMHLPKTPRDKAHWQEIGYTKDKLVGAWKAVIDAYAEAFPRKHLAIDVSLPIYQDGVVYDVLAYAHARLGKRLCVQHNALAAKTQADAFPQQWVASMRGKAAIGFQQLCPVSPEGKFNEDGKRWGGSLEQGLKIGLDAGMRYLEIYPADLRNGALRPAIAELARKLRSLP